MYAKHDEVPIPGYEMIDEWIRLSYALCSCLTACDLCELLKLKDVCDAC